MASRLDPDLVRAALVQRAVRLPHVPRMAQAAARWKAGRHYVGAMAVVTTDGEHGAPSGAVLLARHTIRDDAWGVPGGWVNRGEDPAAACRREVLEETGIEVGVDDAIGCDLHAVDGVPLRYGGLTIAYRCHPLSRAADHPQPRSIELLELRWCTEADATQLVSPFERSMISKALRWVPPIPPLDR